MTDDTLARLPLAARSPLLTRPADGEDRTVELRPGRAVVNPKGVWHTADVHEPGDGLFVTPARGTEHRPR